MCHHISAAIYTPGTALSRKQYLQKHFQNKNKDM
jgi:hypothetical protein